MSYDPIQTAMTQLKNDFFGQRPREKLRDDITELDMALRSAGNDKTAQIEALLSEVYELEQEVKHLKAALAQAQRVAV